MTPRQSIKADIAEICRRHDVCMADVMGRSRFRVHINARHEAFWMLRTMYGLSYPRIGQIMGRDHSTVLYGIDRHLERMGCGNRPRKLEWMRQYHDRMRDAEAA